MSRPSGGADPLETNGGYPPGAIDGGRVVPVPEPAYGLARAVTVIVLNHVER